MITDNMTISPQNDRIGKNMASMIKNNINISPQDNQIIGNSSHTMLNLSHKTKYPDNIINDLLLDIEKNELCKFLIDTNRADDIAIKNTLCKLDLLKEVDPTAFVEMDNICLSL
jgi:hypothetical protein